MPPKIAFWNSQMLNGLSKFNPIQFHILHRSHLLHWIKTLASIIVISLWYVYFPYTDFKWHNMVPCNVLFWDNFHNMVRGKKKKEGVKGTKDFFGGKKWAQVATLWGKQIQRSPNYKGNAKFFYFPL